jgi:hypothetical protein
MPCSHRLAGQHAIAAPSINARDSLGPNVCNLQLCVKLAYVTFRKIEHFHQPCNTDLVGSVAVSHGGVLSGVTNFYHCLIVFHHAQMDLPCKYCIQQ